MKASSALSTMCRACAQRTIRTSPQTSLLPPTSTPLPGSTSLPILQQTRSLATTPTSSDPYAPSTTASTPLPSSNSTPSPSPTNTATPTPTPTPTNPLPPHALLNRPPPPTTPKPLHTAIITSIHASTAHATRTIPLPSRALRKSFLTTTHDLVHDPYNILRVGDVIRYSPFTASEHAAREKLRKEVEPSMREKLKREERFVGRKRGGDGRRGGRVRVSWVVRQVVSAFGEGLEGRVVEGGGGESGKEGEERKKGFRHKGSVVLGVQRQEGTVV